MYSSSRLANLICEARNADAGERPAEQNFPVPIVALHGLLAVTTVVLVFLTAIGVGGS